ncbi:hypothetical protein L1987_82101 [Smallanthus sonchifolius]|uniref:Uncharacterized protein n=1 Tax=Smallanthus sonchifolius TaxID=185202 RepID=A0ACB8YTW7_9ASTR|nr:hypothetical protein L1987_82101 [Smallanthus sonchifolius]
MSGGQEIWRMKLFLLAAGNEMAAAQLALAWVHHQGTDVVPIPGTTKLENFNQNIGALSVKLTPEEMVELESFASSDVVKVERHAYMQNTWINSDTPPLSSWKVNSYSVAIRGGAIFLFASDVISEFIVFPSLQSISDKVSFMLCKPYHSRYYISTTINQIPIDKSQTTMASVVPKVKLGSQGLVVSAQGLGCMGMSGSYGLPKPEPDMINLIHHAIDAGITFLDTSDVYGPQTNEILVGKALKGGLREKVQIATKFGIRRVDGKTEACGDPAYVRSACEASLKRLDIDCIDLYYVHRIDIQVPIEVTMGEIKKLVEEGKVKYVGLSEACASTIRRAHAVHPITAVQNEWSLWSRDLEDEIIPTCRELGIGIVPYSPIGRGFLAVGPSLAENLIEGDFRKSMPRFQNMDHNKTVFERVNEMATRKGCTAAQLALAWVHHQGSDVVPIPGTTKLENLKQNIGALSVKLTPEEMAELESFALSEDVKGERHALMHLTWINSETPPLSSWKGNQEVV